MRDPLAGIPIRYKLTLGFVGLCFLAYAIGGGLVSSAARDALREQILRRLRAASTARATGLDDALRTLTLRARDFASDGLVRTETERIVGGGGLDGAAGLTRHLRENKLPIVPAFVELAVVADDGSRLAGDGGGDVADVRALLGARGGADGPVVGRFWGAAVDGGPPTFAVTTPIWDLSRTRRLAHLVCRADVARLLEAVPVVGGEDDLEDVVLAVADATGAGFEALHGPGGTLAVRATAPSGRAPRDRHDTVLSTPARTATADWRVVVESGTARALRPVEGLQSRFLGAGVLIAGATAMLLFFPLRFLVRPLGRLRDAALRISDGDFSARVAVESRDEIGDLAEGFNRMAEAVADRASRLQASAADLAARKHELTKERDRLDTVVRSMRDPLILFDDAGRIALSNAAAAPLLPVLSSARAHDLALRCARGDGGSTRDCVRCLAFGELAEQSCRLEVGSRVYEAIASRIPSAGGWLGRLLVARDVTELVTLDERQARQERFAVLGEVAAVVAHELNNPLAAVGMYAQMMEDELPAGSPFREHVAVIRRNTEAASRTIRGLLDSARHAEPEVGTVDVDEALEDVARFLRPLLRRARVELVHAPAGPPVELHADPLQLRQVLVNLVMNATQATEGVGTRVEVGVRTEDAGETVVVDVADDGPGVAPEHRERIFDAFFTTKAPGKGTGLGLPISRRIVEDHGGTLVLAESRRGRTVFRVRLPRTSAVEGRHLRPTDPTGARG